jgi:hypothetical protein
MSLKAYNPDMRTTDEQGQAEKEKAEQIIADTPLMDGIESISVELGDDHTGDPAMWLVCYMERDLKPDDGWFRRFNEFSHQLGMRIIHSGLTRFPYTRLRDAA